MGKPYASPKNSACLLMVPDPDFLTVVRKRAKFSDAFGGFN